MEVHHHSHTARKKWTHYFWEFLMLFFAVTLGFFVENQREHYIEKKRERKYIYSLINDLEADTAKLTRYKSQRENKIRRLDSLLMLLTSGKYREMGAETYLYARWMTRGVSFIPSNGTIQQLKNAGALRLIHKQDVADSIMTYDGLVRQLQSQDEVSNISQEKFRDVAGDAFRADIFYHIMDSASVNLGLMIRPSGNPQLLTSDPLIINKIALAVQYEASLVKINLRLGDNLRIAAIRLIELLKKEYHLK